MQDDNKKDQRSPRKSPRTQPERITKAQDRYPESWSYGIFGNAYRWTWFANTGGIGNAIPKLKGE